MQFRTGGEANFDLEFGFSFYNSAAITTSHRCFFFFNINNYTEKPVEFSYLRETKERFIAVAYLPASLLIKACVLYEIIPE